MSPNESTQTFRAQKKRYRLIQRIAQGPMSNVWRARDTLTGRDVVLKRLEAGSVDDPVARRRLADEAAASDLVSHPNSVPVVDTTFGNKEAALVFPYVQGQTLADRLRAGPPIAPRQAAAIALDVGDVLADAHDSGLVHRDVKPANILLGDDGRARLIDFGISRSIGQESDAYDASEAAIELTGSGMAIGTLPYMAPEHLTGAKPSPAADVFALGVVLYEMLAGSRPYDGRSPAEQLELQQRPPAAIEAPAALATLAMGALDPRPESRPSAAQFGRSLRAWLDGRSDAESATTTLPVTPVPAVAASPPARRVNAGMIALAALFLGAVVAVPAVVGILGNEGALPTAPAAQPPAPGLAVVEDTPPATFPETEAPPRQGAAPQPADQDPPAASGSNSNNPHPGAGNNSNGNAGNNDKNNPGNKNKKPKRRH
ncbi:MAG: serine/threonine-protein kinase [Candidatus Limnocylindrales bacterium]